MSAIEDLKLFLKCAMDDSMSRNTTVEFAMRAISEAVEAERAAIIVICKDEVAHARMMMDRRAEIGLEIHGWQCRSTGAMDIVTKITERSKVSK